MGRGWLFHSIGSWCFRTNRTISNRVALGQTLSHWKQCFKRPLERGRWCQSINIATNNISCGVLQNSSPRWQLFQDRFFLDFASNSSTSYKNVSILEPVWIPGSVERLLHQLSNVVLLDLVPVAPISMFTLVFASLWWSDCQPFPKNSCSDGLVVQVRETNE